VKRIFKVGNEYFENKNDAKLYRNKLENYTPVRNKETGKLESHNWKFTVKRGPDHWKGTSK
jgi:hypothetical protein